MRSQLGVSSFCQGVSSQQVITLMGRIPVCVAAYDFYECLVLLATVLMYLHPDSNRSSQDNSASCKHSLPRVGYAGSKK